jgi:2-methylcitrate dehydratase
VHDQHPEPGTQVLLDGLRRGDRQALARLLTLVSRGEEIERIRESIARATPRTARVIAVTGSAGVGKSTLIGKLIEQFRAKNQTVAVLACDPQSPLTGGALLGDRFRMPSRPEDSGVFIRSLATASGHGAIAERIDLMIDLLAAFGFDWIVLETVGAGQGDTAVRELADAVVLLLQPEAGDDIQWEKAGLLEVADMVVIHKADLPGAERVEAQVRDLLNLPGCRALQILRVSAAKQQGLGALVSWLEKVPERRTKPSDGTALLKLAQERLAERFTARHDRVDPIRERWQRHELDSEQAIDELLRALS